MLNAGFSKKPGETLLEPRTSKLNSNMASTTEIEPATQANALTNAPTKFSVDKKGIIVRIDILSFESRPDFKKGRYIKKRAR